MAYPYLLETIAVISLWSAVVFHLAFACQSEVASPAHGPDPRARPRGLLYQKSLLVLRVLKFSDMFKRLLSRPVICR
jgi:hypothetical protein